MPQDIRPLKSIEMTEFAADNDIPHHEFEDINSSVAIETLREHGSDEYVS